MFDVLNILMGGGIVTLITYLIQRHDNRSDKLDTIMQAIERLEQKGDERNAVTMRVRILKFRDEMLEGRSHSHDAFQQVLSDIDEYEHYCEKHAEFRNNQTVATIEHIRRNYAERLERRDFL